MNDKRIGRNAEKGREWPATSISGHAYRREGASIVFLGGELFAVLDAFPSKNMHELILELQAIADVANKPKSRKVETFDVDSEA